MNQSPDFEALADRLDAGEADAQEAAVAFLVAGPWAFRSGYAKEKVANRLARRRLSWRDQVALADVCVRIVDAGDRWEFESYCRLAASLPSMLLRDALVARLGSADEDQARRALWMLARLRRPRLAAEQLAAARAGTVRFAEHDESHIQSLRRLAIRFWSTGWEEELLAMASGSAEGVAGALRTLSALPRLHVADPGIPAVLVYALAEGDPPRDLARWMVAARRLVVAGSLDAAVEGLLDSSDVRTQRLAQQALNVRG